MVAVRSSNPLVYVYMDRIRWLLEHDSTEVKWTEKTMERKTEQIYPTPDLEKSK